jgi:hypothetical protein
MNKNPKLTSQVPEKMGSVIHTNASDIFIFSVKQYILLQPLFWRLTLISALLLIGGLFLYAFCLQFINSFLLSSLFLSIYLYFLISLWLPFEFFVKLKILRKECSQLTFLKILKLFKEVLKNFHILKQFTRFSWNWFVFTESAKFKAMTTIKSMFLGYEINLQNIYPYLLNKNLPFILADRKTPYQIYELLLKTNKDDQEEIKGFIRDDLKISSLTILLLIGLFVLPVQLIAVFVLRLLPTIDQLTLINLIPFSIITLVILILYFFSPLLFIYNFYKYKFFWSKYFT